MPLRAVRRMYWLPLLLLTLAWSPLPADELTGRDLMEESFRRHDHHPYTYEQQSLILTDKAGRRDVRRLRRFSRAEEDGTVRFLLTFDYPPEVRGVALLATWTGDDAFEHSLYLPAFGARLKTSSEGGRRTPFLGSDFTVQDLLPEPLDQFEYQREADVLIDELPHFVITARPRDTKVQTETGYHLRRLYLRQDSHFVVRIDYFDRLDRPSRRRTAHDLLPVRGEMWRAGMVLMEDLESGHASLLKTARRVFSPDYVPSELFTAEWILAKRHMRDERAAFLDRGTDVNGETAR